MKKLFLIMLLASFMGVTFGQVASLGKVGRLAGSRDKARVNAVIDMANVHQDSLEAYATDFTTGDLVVTGSASFADPVSLDSTLMLGTFGDSQQILSEASSNTNVLLGVYPMVNFAGSSGKVFAGQHTRMLVNAAQTNNVSIYGTESQLRVKGANLGQGVHSGIWAYAEQSGTTALTGAGTFTGLHAAIESAAGFSAGATETVAGVSINSSINAGATINASANYSGLYIESSGLDFHDGIYITGATNDIKLQNGETIDNATDGTVAITGNLAVNGTFNYAADAQSDDDYEIALPNVTALVEGLMVIFKANTANTGACTLEITGIGDIDAIKKLNDQDPGDNHIEAGQMVMVVFDGTNWQILNVASN